MMVKSKYEYWKELIDLTLLRHLINQSYQVVHTPRITWIPHRSYPVSTKEPLTGCGLYKCSGFMKSSLICFSKHVHLVQGGQLRVTTRSNYHHLWKILSPRTIVCKLFDHLFIWIKLNWTLTPIFLFIHNVYTYIPAFIYCVYYTTHTNTYLNKITLPKIFRNTNF